MERSVGFRRMFGGIGSAGDYVQLEVRQTSGLTDSVQHSDHSPTLTMAWLGPSS